MLIQNRNLYQVKIDLLKKQNKKIKCDKLSIIINLILMNHKIEINVILK
jgi:hypothetical protein